MNAKWQYLIAVGYMDLELRRNSWDRDIGLETWGGYIHSVVYAYNGICFSLIKRNQVLIYATM